MDFAYSDKVKTLQAKLARFMDEHIYPNEGRFHEEVEANRAKGNPWVPTKLIEELKPKARSEGLWNLFLPRSPRAPAGALEPGVRAAVRDHGARALGAGGVQLLGARHRQHGDAGALRHRGAEEAMARSAARRRESARPSS